MYELRVNAFWDDEAKVWVATSEDVPGLATEAETQEALLEKLKLMIPELLALNGVKCHQSYPAPSTKTKPPRLANPVRKPLWPPYHANASSCWPCPNQCAGV